MPKRSNWGWHDCLNTPAFLRREGRRKRKAGAKNEKAIIIIADFPKRSTKKTSSKMVNEIFFDDNILSKIDGLIITARLFQNDNFRLSLVSQCIC
jgi:hypothetical protein